MADGERNLALSSQTIDAFQDQIGLVQSYQIHNLPDLREHINHAGKYTRPSIKLGTGLFLDKTVVPVHPEHEHSNLFSFLAQPGHRLGREKSHNEVFFGKMLSDNAPPFAGTTEAQVAVKPTKNQAALLGELAMFQYLNELKIPTFQPTGLLVSKPNEPDYLLTKFQKPVATMDTVEWDELDTPEKWLQLGFAVETMALLHSNMLFHGDLEFKNVAFGERGDMIVVDPELTVSSLEMAAVAETSRDSEAVARAQLRIKQSMSNDFTSVCKSIDEFIISALPPMERPKSSAAKFKTYARHLLRPYRQAIVEINSEHTRELLTAYETMFQDHKQRSRE